VRRDVAGLDPTGWHVEAADGRSLLRDALGTMQPEERLVLAARFSGIHRGDIAAHFKTTSGAVRAIEARAMWHLRRNSYGGMLRDYADLGEYHHLGQVLMEVLQQDRELAALADLDPRCEHCTVLIPGGAARVLVRGRPRRFCSNSCRQAAYRARRPDSV
jgi:Sigma-70, region 4